MGDLKNTETIEQVAGRVRGLLEGAEKLTVRAFQTRLEAGRQLLALRPRVEAEGHRWNRWCEQHIDRSRGEIALVMKMARTADPEASAAAERENARQRKAEQRERDKSLQDDVRDVTDTETQQLLAVAQEEKVAAEAAQQRQQQAMAAAFQADQAVRGREREREADADDAGDEAADERAEAEALSSWIARVSCVLNDSDLEVLCRLCRGEFGRPCQLWVAGELEEALKTRHDSESEPEPDADADETDYEDLTGPGIDRRNGARIAARGAGA